ncbi:MAG: FIG00998270: hypothetical protein, partial [uncultured Nocardioidaceae bacterium]
DPDRRDAVAQVLGQAVLRPRGRHRLGRAARRRAVLHAARTALAPRHGSVGIDDRGAAHRAVPARARQHRERRPVVRDHPHADDAARRLRPGPAGTAHAVLPHRDRGRVPPLGDVRAPRRQARRPCVRRHAAHPSARPRLQDAGRGRQRLRVDPRRGGDPGPVAARGDEGHPAPAADPDGLADPRPRGGQAHDLRPAGGRAHGADAHPRRQALAPGRHRADVVHGRPEPDQPARVRRGGARPAGGAEGCVHQPDVPGDDGLDGRARPRLPRRAGAAAVHAAPGVATVAADAGL